jgi:hypothetical protein
VLEGHAEAKWHSLLCALGGAKFCSSANICEAVVVIGSKNSVKTITEVRKYASSLCLLAVFEMEMI